LLKDKTFLLPFYRTSCDAGKRQRTPTRAGRTTSTVRRWESQRAPTSVGAANLLDSCGEPRSPEQSCLSAPRALTDVPEANKLSAMRRIFGLVALMLAAAAVLSPVAAARAESRGRVASEPVLARPLVVVSVAGAVGGDEEITPVDIAQDAIQGVFVLFGIGGGLWATKKVDDKKSRSEAIDEAVATCQAVMTDVNRLIANDRSPADLFRLESDMQSALTLSGRLPASMMRVKISDFISLTRPVLRGEAAVTPELVKEVASAFEAVRVAGEDLRRRRRSRAT
jgi:hypothetical protein